MGRLTMEYISYNHINTWEKYGLILFEREVNPPHPRRQTLEIAHTNGVWDYSRKAGQMFYEERILHYGFKKVIPDRQSRERLRTIITNDFTAYQEDDPLAGILYESLDMYMNYHQVTLTNLFFSDMKDNLFIVQMDFVAYPYRKSSTFIGDDWWDAFSFDFGVTQDTSVKLPSIESQAPFKPLSVGSMVTQGGWAREYGAEGQQAVDQFEGELFREIKDTRPDTSSDISQRQYLLDNGVWVKEQQIVQARHSSTPIRLFNPSNHPIFPEIRQTWTGSAFAGITIEKDNQLYNFRKRASGEVDDGNDRLTLKPGWNDLKIFGQTMTVAFLYSREMF